jgi:hypothetical protein
VNYPSNVGSVVSAGGTPTSAELEGLNYDAAGRDARGRARTKGRIRIVNWTVKNRHRSARSDITSGGHSGLANLREVRSARSVQHAVYKNAPHTRRRYDLSKCCAAAKAHECDRQVAVVAKNLDLMGGERAKN